MIIRRPDSPKLAERPPPFPPAASHRSNVTPERVKVESSVMCTVIPPPSLVEEQVVNVVKDRSTAHAAESDSEIAPPFDD